MIELWHDAWWQAYCANGRLLWVTAALIVDTNLKWFGTQTSYRALSAIREVTQSHFGKHEVIVLRDPRKGG